MSLQARKAPAALKPYIQESLERIGAMGRGARAALPQRRCQRTFGAHVLIQTICQDLSQIYGRRRWARFICRVEAPQPVQLPLDVATPLALIVNEVVSNAFKHAFADGRRGEIVVTLDETAEWSMPRGPRRRHGIRARMTAMPSRSRWACG